MASKSQKSAARARAKAHKSGSSSDSGVSGDLSKAQKAYEQTLAPSAEETAAQTGLTNLNASKDLGVSQLQTTQGGQVPLSFITGQQSSLTEQASAKAIPLQAQLTALQARRQSAMDVAKQKVTDLTSQQTAQNAQKVQEIKNQGSLQLQALKNSKPSAAKKAAAPKKATVADILGGTDNWDIAAANAQKAGIPVYKGSAFDIAANKRWNPKDPFK